VVGNGAATVWLLAGDRLGLADALAARLESDGDTVIRLDTGKHMDGTGPKAAVHLIDFTGGRADGGEKDCVAPKSWSSVGVVNRGERDRRHIGEATAGAPRFFLDLDAEQPADEQVECLYQALRHPDEQRIVAYRCRQRYVSASQEENTANEGDRESTP